MNSLEALVNRHRGQPAFIFGTGPSLDRFDFEACDELVNGSACQICLNRTFGVVPIHRGRTYWLVQDDAWRLGVPGPWHEWLEQLRRHPAGEAIGIFMDPMYGPKNTRTPAPTGRNIVHFTQKTRQPDYLFEWPRERVAASGELYTYAGTGCTAVHAAWLMGCSHVVLVGMDGGDGYAERVLQWYDKPKRGGFGYVMPKTCTLDTAFALKMKVVDFSENPEETE